MRFTISSIELTNFRQYRGEQTINFAYDKKKNVAIIIGKNGAGKSNLLNALTWCFYGIETHTGYEDNEKMPLISTGELSNLQPNQKTSAEVRIYLDTDNGSWTIKRTIEGGKHDNGNIYVDPDSTLTVAHPVGGQDKVETGKDTEVLINNILPNDLKQFFFMDGERLKEFFNKDTTQTIGDSIEKVSQLDLMYNAAEHLEAHEKDLRKSVKQSTPKLDEINGEIQHLQGRLDKLKEIINKNKDNIKKNNQEFKEVKDFLKNCGIEHVEQLENERQSLEQSIKLLESRRHSRVVERNRYLVKMAPFIYLKKPIDKTLGILLKNIEKGDLPPKIKETLVLELIDKGKCICGTKIEGETKKILEEYSKTLGLSEIGEISIVGKTKYKDVQEDLKEFPQKMDDYHEEIQSYEDELETKRRRLQQITDELKIGEDKAKIIVFEQRRDELIKDTARLEQRISLDSAESKEATKMLDEKRAEYDKELGFSEKNKKLKTKLKLVQDTLKTLSQAES
ncbi:MAG: AAA family ATPase, partial [Nanoarchaeota archaeon]